MNEDIRNAGILESRRTQDEITFNTTFSSCFLCFWMIEIELNQLECESEFKLDTVRRKEIKMSKSQPQSLNRSRQASCMFLLFLFLYMSGIWIWKPSLGQQGGRSF